MIRAAALLAAISFAPAARGASDADLPARRISISVGNDTGDASRQKLRYAERDAAEMHAVLTSLGGASSAHLLVGRDVAALEAIFDRVEAELRADPSPATVLFYYSGHADDRALLLRNDRYELSRLRSRLESMSARLFVAIVDACQSGNLTRFKGGTSVPIVDLDVFTEDRRFRGGVYITSSAPGENAQESDELEASFFTHYLASGLRGAADESGDARVSLDEAYRFAYRRTVERTSGTLLGAQHPTFAVDLSGQGQLILTWLPSDKSYLVFPEKLRGTYLVRAKSSGELVAEISKTTPKRVRVALEPGQYQVGRPEGEVYLEQTVDVAPAAEAVLDESKMRDRPLAVLAKKGGGRPSALLAAYRLETGWLLDADPLHGVDLGYFRPLTGDLELGLIGSYGESRYLRRDRLSIALREVGAGIFLQLRRPWGAFDLLLAAEARAVWVEQIATDQLGADERRATIALPAGARATLLIPIEGRFSALAAGYLGLVFHESASGLEAPLAGGFALGMAVDL